MYRSLAFLALGLAFAACTNPADPGGTGTPASSTVTMTQPATMPMVGGDVTGIAIASNNTIYAVVDGGIYSMGASGGPMQLINNNVVHTSLGLAPSGELYALTATEIRTYDLAAGTFKTVPIDPAGPLAINRRVEQSEIVFSPSGEPYIRMINNTPQTYIYHSTDKGSTWINLNMPLGFTSSGGFAFAPNGDMLLTNAYALYRSSDHGATWTTLPAPVANYGPEIMVAANNDIYVYVRGGGGLRVSHDGGASFTDLAMFNRAPYYTALQQGPDGALYALAAGSASVSDLGSRPTSLFRSSNGGVTWTRLVFAQGRVFAMKGSAIAIGVVANNPGANVTHGGFMISQNNGGTWSSAGTKAVTQVMDVGFDKDGNVMMLADNGLYRRTASGWQALGTQPGAFARFASNRQGALLLANTGSVFYSGDNGVTWKESPVTDYSPGIDPASITTIIGKKDGEFLMSITSYSDNRGYSNGQVYRIGADGVPVKNTGITASLSSMVEDHNGALYGGSQTVNGFTGQFMAINYQSSDGGRTWTEITSVKVGRAYNSQNKYFSIDGNSAYSLRVPGSDQKTDLKLEGFTSLGNAITRVAFGPDDKLYLISTDKGLFTSVAPVR
jgi:photosystem II stability/assembly factor-like uncharacterized protein